jgi:hypothetical protein
MGLVVGVITPLDFKENHFEGFQVYIHYIFEIDTISHIRCEWILVTPMGNISNLENHNYPTVIGFIILIQLFGVIYFVVAPHAFVTFHLHV